MHVRSWSENLFFDSGDFRFTVWTQEGAGEEDHSAGVMVEQDGREVGRHACSMPTLRAELASLSTAVPHGPEHQPE
jgi:hypothetical protein